MPKNVALIRDNNQTPPTPSSAASQHIDQCKPIPILRTLKDLETFLQSLPRNDDNDNNLAPPKDNSLAARDTLHAARDTLHAARDTLHAASRDAEGTLAWWKQRQQADKAALKSLQELKAARAAAAPPSAQKTIVTPGFQLLTSYQPLSPFRYTEPYLKSSVHRDYVQPLQLSRGDIVHYDITIEDINFLRRLLKINDQHANPGEIPLALEENFIRLIEQFENNSLNSPISLDLAIAIAQSLPTIGNTISLNVIKAIFNHWVERRAVLQKPLLRVYWGEHLPTMPASLCVFQTKLRSKDRMALRRPRRSLQDAAKRFDMVMMDLRKVDRILRQMVRRDKQKLLIAELNGCIFEQMRREQKDPTYVNPYWLYLKKNKLGELLGETSNDFAIEQWVDNITESNTMTDDSAAQTIQKRPEKQILVPSSSRVCLRMRDDGGLLWIDRLSVEGVSSHTKVVLGSESSSEDDKKWQSYTKIYNPDTAVELGPPLANVTEVLKDDVFLHTMRQCRLLQFLVSLSVPLRLRSGGGGTKSSTSAPKGKNPNSLGSITARLGPGKKDFLN